MLLIWNMFNLFPTINSPKHVFIWLSSYFLFLQMCYLKFSVNEKQNKDFLFCVNVCSQMEFPSLVVFTFFPQSCYREVSFISPYSCLPFFFSSGIHQKGLMCGSTLSSFTRENFSHWDFVQRLLNVEMSGFPSDFLTSNKYRLFICLRFTSYSFYKAVKSLQYI